MNRYEFTIILSGYGEAPEIRWEDAVDTIYGDTNFGQYNELEIETKMTDENIDY